MVKRVLLLASLLVAGCHYSRDDERAAPLRTESQAIEQGTAETVHVDLKMGAGTLDVIGGAQKLMEAEFRYNYPAWKPEVRYELSGLRGTLTVEQPKRGAVHTGNLKNEWKLKFNNNARMDMAVRLGAGEGDLELGSLTLKGLEIEVGAGQLKLDLRGNPRRSYDVRIRGGVGDANIYLPTKVGIIADVKGGIGSIDARGLVKRDDRYVNDEYGKSEITIRLDVKGGIGSINLIAE